MLLSATGIKKAFGSEPILKGLSFRIDRREKVALVGRNGSGKTTLLKIILGQMEPDGGAVTLARGARLGFLRQENPVGAGNTVLEEAEQARREAVVLRARLDELEAVLSASPTESDLEEYATLHEHYLELEGYSAERDMRTVLQKMGFSQDEFEKPAALLSGGEKTRLALARLLLEQPDLLLLDEPTNHLDLQATEWLEGWLKAYPGAVLLVSHDRTFLGGTADRVLDLRDGVVKSYPGPFEKYLQLRQEEEEREVEVEKRRKAEVDRLDEYVRRFINSQRTAQARGRLKMKEKLMASARPLPKPDKNMKGGFKPSKRSGDVVVECSDLAMGFDGELLFKDLDWTVRIGERWGVIGENGSGKSTLIRAALGHAQPVAGRARIGSQVQVGYFAQDTVGLDLDQSPLDYLVWEFDLLPADARDLLGRFLISGDDVYRPIRTMSGGEKNKLVLAGLTSLRPNLLVLDEPTNHLDMASREALAGVIAEFEGTLILVSHDRWLLRRVTDHTLDLRKTGVTLYSGSYGEYRDRSDPTVLSRQTDSSTPANKTSDLISPRELSKAIGKAERAIEELEDQIHGNERELAELETKLSNLPSGADVLALTTLHTQLKEHIEGGFAAWEEQVALLTHLRSLQGGAAS